MGVYKHGMSDTRFYRLYHTMKRRCYDKNLVHYPNYGGRGIKVCDRWLNFNNFKEDMYESYLDHVEKYGEKDTTLDRIDPNSDYCLENCRWATWETQRHNKSHIFLIKDLLDDEILTIKEYCRKYNLKYGAMAKYAYEHNLTLVEALKKYAGGNCKWQNLMK